jgi:hypothetical protein
MGSGDGEARAAAIPAIAAHAPLAQPAAALAPLAVPAAFPTARTGDGREDIPDAQADAPLPLSRRADVFTTEATAEAFLQRMLQVNPEQQKTTGYNGMTSTHSFHSTPPSTLHPLVPNSTLTQSHCTASAM